MDRDTLAALDANYLDANRAFVCGADTGEYVERRDIAIVCCGLPAQALNFGFLKPPYGATSPPRPTLCTRTSGRASCRIC